MPSDEFRHSYRVDDRENLGLAVYSCGVQKCIAGHSWGPAVRDHFLIHYIVSGHGIYETGGKRYELSAGHGFLAVPSQVIHYAADQNDPWQYCWVGFNGTEAAHLLQLAGLSAEHPVFRYDKDARLEDELKAILRATGSRPSDEARMRGRLLEFLASLIELIGTNQRYAGDSNRRHVDRALQFIQYNYSRPIGVGDIAASAGISRSQLYRLFIRYLSISPTEYLTKFRIREACFLLCSQGLSVSEAAYSSGFSDQLYFSRVFKKEKGMSPSRYLKQIRSEETNREKAEGI